MADLHVRRKRLESGGTDYPVPDLIAFILPINKFIE